SSQYAVCSYTPTLNALLHARKNLQAINKAQAKILLVAEPGPPNSSDYLPNAVSEVESIARILKSQNILRSDTAQSVPWRDLSVEDIQRLLPEAHLFHVACHGKQDFWDALQSAFVLKNRSRLSVAHLMALQLSKAFFVYMSACETATGDTKQPDQAIHLAMTMLFVGFKSVVGTMWSLHDRAAPLVAQMVYGELYKEDQSTLDPQTIPYALDMAVHNLRMGWVEQDRGQVRGESREYAAGRPAAYWATFVHMGV
ncbi:hypothetical protein K474DRAFT_1592405, partial [Panus rudis PR-1116 ss-1]